MKKSTFLYFLLVGFVCVVSCSKETESSQKEADFTVYDVLSLKNYYEKTILTDPTYIAQRRYHEELFDKLNGQNASLESRENFVKWMTYNISKTDFDDLNSAIRFYDDYIDAGETFFNKFQDFYLDLESLDPKDIKLIVEGGFSSTPASSNTSPCQDDCIDTVNAAFDKAEDNYFNQLANPSGIPSILSWWVAERNYWKEINAAVTGFNNCMGGCSR